MRAFMSQKGPGKGLPASGFAPERRESPEFPRAPRSSEPLPSADEPADGAAEWRGAARILRFAGGAAGAAGGAVQSKLESAVRALKSKLHSSFTNVPLAVH